MIKYLGSKRTLIPSILRVIRAACPAPATVLDLFSGTSRVGHALKRAGYRVIANDHNAYAHTLAACYIQADAEDVLPQASALIGTLNATVAAVEPGSTAQDSGPRTQDPGRRVAVPTPSTQDHWFTRDYCVRSRYFRPDNGERIAAVREAIDGFAISPDLRAILLTSLMEAADRVDSTTGLQMAYLKDWAPRARNPLELRLPAVLPRAAAGRGEAHALDALDAAERLDADLAYIDPPYNQHSYLGNYHVWETLVRWDHPEVYGTACKRADVRARRSRFNSRRECRNAFADLIAAVRAPILVVSFSDEGYLAREEVESILAARGHIATIAHDYKRYVGAQIGIYNPRGQKVGRVGRLRNTEYLYVVARDRALIERAASYSAAISENAATVRPTLIPTPAS